jgi:hypothetical protein
MYPGHVSSAAMSAMLTIAPLAAARWGAAACDRKNGARRFSEKSASHASTVTLPTGVRTISAAELTRTSSEPWAPRACSTSAGMADGSRRSAATSDAVPPAAAIASAVRRAPASLAW